MLSLGHNDLTGEMWGSIVSICFFTTYKCNSSSPSSGSMQSLNRNSENVRSVAKTLPKTAHVLALRLCVERSKIRPSLPEPVCIALCVEKRQRVNIQCMSEIRLVAWSPDFINFWLKAVPRMIPDHSLCLNVITRFSDFILLVQTAQQRKRWNTGQTWTHHQKIPHSLHSWVGHRVSIVITCMLEKFGLVLLHML